jgi:tetratricopeptide (TPR) repeat protein
MVARAIILVLALLVCTGRDAGADDKPWAAGVAPDQQKRALALYREGNTYFEQAQYKEALAKYELALERWDHPAIQYNAAICLINLDRLPAAWDRLERALRFGEPPLGVDLYKEALRYQKQLAGQLGELEITCDEAGADIQLDGQPLFVGPGHASKRLVAGTHRMVATKEPDFITQTQTVELAGGGKQQVTIVLEKRPIKIAGPKSRVARRWSTWKPWAVIGGGVIVGGIGGLTWKLAHDDFATHDGAVAEICPMGCPAAELRDRAAANREPAAASQLLDRLDLDGRAKTERAVTYSAFAIGGAAIAAGVVLVVMNQPREVAIAPTIGTEHAGLVLAGRW